VLTLFILQSLLSLLHHKDKNVIYQHASSWTHSQSKWPTTISSFLRFHQSLWFDSFVLIPTSLIPSFVHWIPAALHSHFVCWRVITGSAKNRILYLVFWKYIAHLLSFRARVTSMGVSITAVNCFSCVHIKTR